MSGYAGIPALLEAVDFGKTIASKLLAADAPMLPLQIEEQKWGVYFDDGVTLALVPDTIEALNFSNDSRLSGFPIEKGSFASFNKVATPYRARIRMAYAGLAVADRQYFLQAVEALQQSLDLLHVVTPEITYLNANVTRYDYQRDLSNAGMIVVDLLIEEVRIVGQNTARSSATALTYVKNPEAADPTSLGQVQPLIPSVGQLVKAANFPALANLPVGLVQDAATGLLVQATGQIDRVLSARSALQLIPGLPQVSIL